MRDYKKDKIYPSKSEYTVTPSTTPSAPLDMKEHENNKAYKIFSNVRIYNLVTIILNATL